MVLFHHRSVRTLLLGMSQFHVVGDRVWSLELKTWRVDVQVTLVHQTLDLGACLLVRLGRQALL